MTVVKQANYSLTAIIDESDDFIEFENVLQFVGLHKEHIKKFHGYII